MSVGSFGDDPFREDSVQEDPCLEDSLGDHSFREDSVQGDSFWEDPCLEDSLGDHSFREESVQRIMSYHATKSHVIGESCHIMPQRIRVRRIQLD